MTGRLDGGRLTAPVSLVLSAITLAGSTPCAAQDANISLIDLYQGSSLSALAESLATGGYELQDGTWVSFDKWYHTDWIDLHADFLTQLTDDNAILWGLGTGERGEKYRIDPSVKLGFITQAHPRSNSTLSLTVTTTIGGSLTELPCVADYGDIGGVQEVNCRLAAGELPPEETLKYLVKAEPARLHIAIAYRASF